MKRIQRDRRLTPEEAAKARQVRAVVDAELPELIERHHERMASLDDVSRPDNRHGTKSRIDNR